MRILTYLEYTSKKLSQYESNNIEASSMKKEIAEEKEQLIKEINKIVGTASEAGIKIQISNDELIKGKLYIKVLINEIEHFFSLEGNLLKIKTMEGGMLDNVKGNSDKILNILIGKTPRIMYTFESNEN